MRRLTRLGIGQIKNGMQQYIASSEQISLLSIFELIVAQSVFARHEYHPGWGDVGKVHGIMTRAADHLH